MKLLIAAIGAKPDPAYQTLIEDYLGRARALGRSMGFSGPDIAAMDAPRAHKDARRKSGEAKALLAAAPRGAKIIALDENGKHLTSVKFAQMLGAWRDDGAPGAALLIGGADGHDASIATRADLCLSFGALTWPHMLARVMAAEQLYRAMTILAGHPYHRS